MPIRRNSPFRRLLLTRTTLAILSLQILRLNVSRVTLRRSRLLLQRVTLTGLTRRRFRDIPELVAGQAVPEEVSPAATTALGLWGVLDYDGTR